MPAPSFVNGQAFCFGKLCNYHFTCLFSFEQSHVRF